MRALGIALSSVVIVACSALVDTSGLTGATLAASDASPGAMDAGADVPVGDKITGKDGGLIPSPCPGDFDFCDDFDTTSEEFVPPWGTTFLNRGSLTYSTDIRRSGTRAVRSATRATGDTDNAAVLFKYFNYPVRRIVTAWDMYVSRVDADGVLYIGKPAIGERGIRIQAQNSLRFFYEDAGEIASAPAYKKNEWVHFEIDLSLTSFTVRVDGEVVVDAVALDPPLVEANPQINVGVYFGSSPSTGHEVYYDNVTVKTE